MRRNSLVTCIDSSDLRVADERRAISEIATAIDLAARSDVRVLITGETGSGKELIARWIHRRSVRAAAPFVTVSCAGVPERELESELFGHMRNGRARHVDRAQSGTIFLEEVAGISPRIQERLFKLIETLELRPTDANLPHRTDNVRLMTATSSKLYANVVAGEFREDLYYRLNVIHVRVPLFRERLSDVALLVGRFLDAHTSDLPRGILPECDCAAPSPGGTDMTTNGSALTIDDGDHALDPTTERTIENLRAVITALDRRVPRASAQGNSTSPVTRRC